LPDYDSGTKRVFRILVLSDATLGYEGNASDTGVCPPIFDDLLGPRPSIRDLTPDGLTRMMVEPKPTWQMLTDALNTACEAPPP
jgi:hypothetical protein